MAKKRSKTVKKANGNGHAKANTPPKLSAGKRQLEIAQAARPIENKELEALARPYVETLYRRMELERSEPAMRDAIFDKMQELKIPVFVIHDGEAKYEIKTKLIDPKKKVSVKRHEASAP